MLKRHAWLIDKEQLYRLPSGERPSENIQPVSPKIGCESIKKICATENGAWALAGGKIYLWIDEPEPRIFVTESTYENQRYRPFRGFSAENLLPTDRSNWSDVYGKKRNPKDEFVLLSENWRWYGEWKNDTGSHTMTSQAGVDLWEYAFDFPFTWHEEMERTSLVRRRRWTRLREFTAVNKWATVSTITDDGDRQFIDIGVGRWDMSPFLSVWAVATNGDVFARTNVCQDNPEGIAWTKMPSKYKIREINVETNGTVLARSLYFDTIKRSGVSRDNIYGTSWVDDKHCDESDDIPQSYEHVPWVLHVNGEIKPIRKHDTVEVIQGCTLVVNQIT